MQVSAVVTSVTLQVVPLERLLTKKCTLFYLTQTYRIYHWSQSRKWLVTDCFSTRTNSYHLNLTFTTRKTVVVFEHECISKSGASANLGHSKHTIRSLVYCGKLYHCLSKKLIAARHCTHKTKLQGYSQ